MMPFSITGFALPMISLSSVFLFSVGWLQDNMLPVITIAISSDLICIIRYYVDMLMCLYNHPVLHMDGAVGDGGQLLIVGDDDEGLVQLVAQFEEEVVQLYLIVGVETTRRLIGEDHQGVVDQCTGDRHT